MARRTAGGVQNVAIVALADKMARTIWRSWPMSVPLIGAGQISNDRFGNHLNPNKGGTAKRSEQVAYS